MRRRVLAWGATAALALAGLSGVAAAGAGPEAPQQWQLVNPEGVVEIEPMKLNTHPATLEGKTVLLRWNGKHNGDKFLERVGELLVQNVKGVRVINNWEALPDTVAMSQNPDKSKQFAQAMSGLKPDIVIASQAD